MVHWQERMDDSSQRAIDDGVYETIEGESVDVFVPEFDDLPNVIAACHTCTTLEG